MNVRFPHRLDVPDERPASDLIPPAQPPSTEAPHPSPRSLRGLDWFVFFVADVQTGFGPFLSVYLTTQKWTQTDIGFVLSIGGIVALLCQMPGGAIVDWARRERLVAGIALTMITTAALAYACFPIFPVVFSAAVLHAAASCVLGPCIVALSLGLGGVESRPLIVDTAAFVGRNVDETMVDELGQYAVRSLVAMEDHVASAPYRLRWRAC